MRTLLILLIMIFSQVCIAATINGKVIGVSDGDTIIIMDNTNTQHKIRLAGIDAPEKSQAFGSASKSSLSDLVYGKQVDVEWSKRDRYGRAVGKVMVNGVDANLEQLKLGMAWFYKHYENEMSLENRLEYAAAEEYARLNKLGLWTDDNAVPPWDFRKQKKSN